MVTNGYIAPEPLDKYIEFTDAFNVDLKAFSSDKYRRLTGADLDPVKNSLRRIAGSGRHLEVTTLIITGQNDSETEMERQSEWMADELGENVPLHLSRYFPMFKRDDPVTPGSTLLRLYEIAAKYLKYVYIGNSRFEKGQDTRCPSCDTIITRRSGYHTEHLNVEDGNCAKCGKEVYRYFTSSF
jgi:pyruvate formate lyase activating enzyme